MIHLRPDCLVFELTTGEKVPCSAEEMAFELVVGPNQELDLEILRNAAAAVLHYFRSELGQTDVSVKEFTAALRRALSGLGFDVKEGEISPSPSLQTTSPRGEVDLASLEKSAGGGGELEFFQSLRADLLHRLQSSPEMIVYRGLRPCAKGLCAARRWSDRCQEVSDQIVEYLRACLRAQTPASQCVICVY